MSYCRFSSDNFKSEVYVYADISGGYTIHIADNRIVSPLIPDVPYMRLPNFGATFTDVPVKFTLTYPSKMHEFMHKLMWTLLKPWLWARAFSLRHSIRRKIGGPYDGDTMNVATARECVDTLTTLRNAGYVVPQRAIDALLEDAKEEEDVQSVA